MKLFTEYQKQLCQRPAPYAVWSRLVRPLILLPPYGTNTSWTAFTYTNCALGTWQIDSILYHNHQISSRRIVYNTFTLCCYWLVCYLPWLIHPHSWLTPWTMHIVLCTLHTVNSITHPNTVACKFQTEQCTVDSVPCTLNTAPISVELNCSSSFSQDCLTAPCPSMLSLHSNYWHLQSTQTWG